MIAVKKQHVAQQLPDQEHHQVIPWTLIFSAKTQPGAKVGNMQTRQNQFAFFTEESSGLKLSPKTVLILSLLYMIIVVVLHILGKVKNISPAAASQWFSDNIVNDLHLNVSLLSPSYNPI